MQLGDNNAISNALVEIAVSQGKSEAEITAALGPDQWGIAFGLRVYCLRSSQINTHKYGKHRSNYSFNHI
jgi:hypothetical protein